MKARTLALGGLAAAGGGAAVLYRLRSGGRMAGRVLGDWDAADGRTDRWHAVTVNLSPDEVSPGGRLPGPLAELGDNIEVRIRPAPADKGT